MLQPFTPLFDPLLNKMSPNSRFNSVILLTVYDEKDSQTVRLYSCIILQMKKVKQVNKSRF